MKRLLFLTSILTGLDLPDAERQKIAIAFHVNLDDLTM